MKFLIALFMVFAVVIVTVDPVQAAVKECYSYGGSTSSEASSNSNRLYQTFIAGHSPLVSVSLNAYGSPFSNGNLFISIVEMVGGEPSGATVAGTSISTPWNLLPEGSIGVGHEFDCDNIPEGQIFPFPAPITILVPGTEYALEFHATSGSSFYSHPFTTITGNFIPDSEGWNCDGLGVCTSWNLNEHPGGSGFYWDTAFALENQFVDGSGVSDSTINSQIDTFRNYIKLDDDQGGILLTLLAMSILYIAGFYYKINFLVITAMNAILFGLFASDDIVEGWILITAIAVGGMAVVFKINSGGRSPDEG